MRIGFISDIHVDLNRLDGREIVTGLLAAESRRRELDILLVAGDLSSDYRLTLETVRRLREESGARVLFVPGNHDIWNERAPGMKAWDTYNAMLEDPSNLARGPVAAGEGWALAGDLGWYDFSYGDPSFGFDDFSRMEYMGRTWQDRIKSIWDRGTLDMHRHFAGRLDAMLKEAVSGKGGSAPGQPGERATDKAGAAPKLILATHVVQIPEFTVSPPNEMWKYFNAFLGSPDYGRLALEHGAALSVCGHVHFRRRARKGATEFVCPCLGYAAEWPQPADHARQIAETLMVYELDANGAVKLGPDYREY